QVFSNSDEAPINKKLPKELLLSFAPEIYFKVWYNIIQLSANLCISNLVLL
uniref:Uncharacterized protein n=1 Tax=Terrapene triunguis TaxID=2587831 RepID=A0A674JGR5_9SAUR